MAQIDQLNKVYYCPLKSNRRIDDSRGTQAYQRVDELIWSTEELQLSQAHRCNSYQSICPEITA